MRLRDRPPLYIALVRAPEGQDLRETVQGEFWLPAEGDAHALGASVSCGSLQCPAFPPLLTATSGPYRGQRACLLCVARSRAARAIGASGGRVGGRSTSRAKVDAARANGEKGAEVSRKKKLDLGG